LIRAGPNAAGFAAYARCETGQIPLLSQTAFLGDGMSETVYRRPLQKSVKVSLWAVPLVLLLVLLGAAGTRYISGGSASATAGAGAPPPPLVTVSPPIAARAVNFASFTGQFAAVNNVEIRAQVSGYLTQIHFTDGQIVHKGDLLFVIDPRPYQIQLEQAQASVSTAKAQLALANKEEHRISALQNSGAVTPEQLDERVQQVAAAEAALQTANAAVQSAQLNLEFCHITAPFSGRISAHRVSIGALISGGPSAAASTLLTTIVSLDPIYLTFQMSESDYLTYEHYVHSAAPGSPVSNTVQAALSDENGYPRTGTLDFVDNQIDPDSGTIQARATFPNHDLFITPGEFAALRLPVSNADPVLLVPDEALQADQSNQVLMTVAPDGTVVPKIVQTGAMAQGLREIQGGISPNDKIIINGLMRAYPGMKVSTEPGTITASAGD
jgi:multidrug efflux system membrane fusion protein